MAEPTAFALSRHFTSLINREVAFAQSTAALETKTPKVFGVYVVFPEQTALVVKADLSLLGSFAGALIGLPDAEVKQRVSSAAIDELLRDPVQEVLNVASAVVSSVGRAVFKSMTMNPIYLHPDAEKALNHPLHRSYFTVRINGYQGGRFCVFE
ncbi:MAG: hypothetical protein ACLGPM_10935 [Acidobacteriota bacterium]